MIEITLSLVIIALIGALYLEKLQNAKERAKFINALIAKGAKELQELDFVEKAQPFQTDNESKEADDLTPVSQLTDKDFDKFVLGKD